MTELQATWYSAAAASITRYSQRIDESRDVAAPAAAIHPVRLGAPRSESVAGLEEAFGAPMLERYGMSETCTLTGNALPPAQRKAGTVGRPCSTRSRSSTPAGRRRSRHGRRDRRARAPASSTDTSTIRRPPRRLSSTAGFAQVTLGRLDADGYLTLCGRIKDVINRGGEKIGTAKSKRAARPSGRGRGVRVLDPAPDARRGGRRCRRPGAEHAREGARTAVARRAPADGLQGPAPCRFVRVAAGECDEQDRTRRARASPRASAARRGVVDAPERRGTIERQIAALWSERLGVAVDRLGRDDDFFLLGGDSLQVYELFVRLRTRYGIAVGLADLFDDASTVAGMARLVERSRTRRRRLRRARRLVPIKEDGDWPPLFAVPGSGGNPVGYVHLGRLLDRRQPLIGIEARGIDGSSPPLARVEDIAADNLAAMRSAAERSLISWPAHATARASPTKWRDSSSAGEQSGCC